MDDELPHPGNIASNTARQFRRLNGWADSFGNQVSARTNLIDLAAHYPANPERWRMFIDGTRQLLQYTDPSQYNHASDVHEISPASGEEVVFLSSERPRYTVQYELAATWAFSVNQALEGDDTLKVGLYDGTDGWYLEHRGDHPDSQTGDIVTERGGSVVNRVEDVDLHIPVTEFARLKVQTGWYNITRQVWERSFSEDGEQNNPVITKTDMGGDRGPETGNLNLYFSIEADASTTGLTLNAGSAAQVNLGTTVPFLRQKTQSFEATIANADTWEPIYAFRVDPDREIVNVQVVNLDIVDVSDTGADVKAMVMSFDQSKTDASGYGTPAEHSAKNSVIEEASSVSTFPDSTGTEVSTASNPGGYQLAYSSVYSSGAGANTVTRTGSRTRKRPLFNGDIGVVLAYSDTASVDVTAEVVTEQDW